ncbi:helix-turn-helix transcriptional regulator [Micromonospora sonneratiae]|uniref:Helix-turn-helix domain-containing protein n=1 Tax=Micromonospora sonneratiae TaxID=1184706 RepID=A0ABW3YFA2_9ACTN
MDVEVGQRILALRTARGLTQRALAEPRYTAAYISSVERGRRIPSNDALTHFADRLGVPLIELATGRSAAAAVDLDLDLAGADATAAGDPAAAEATYLRVAEASGDDVVRSARCQLGLGRLALTDGQVETASRHFDDAWRLLADADPRVRAEAVAGQAACARLRGAPGYAAYLLTSERDELHRAGYPDPAALLALHAQLAACLAELGNEEAAAEAAEAALALAGLPDPAMVADLHLTVARTLLAGDRLEAAATALDQARQARNQATMRPTLAQCHHIRGRARLASGDIAGAAADLLTAHRDYTATGQSDSALDTGVDLAQVHRALGRPAHARALLDAALAAVDPAAIDAVNPGLGTGTVGPAPGTDRATSAHPLRAARVHRVLAMLAVDSGDDAAAEQHLRTAVQLYRRTGPRRELAQVAIALADLLTASGGAPAALEVLHAGLTGIEELITSNRYD